MSSDFYITPEPYAKYLPEKDKWLIQGETIANFSFNGGFNGLFIRIPDGFETDFASIPRILRNILSRQGVYNRAAIIHDYLCEHRNIPRALTDEIFNVIMYKIGVPWYKRYPIYRCVRTYGIVRKIIRWIKTLFRKGK